MLVSFFSAKNYELENWCEDEQLGRLNRLSSLLVTSILKKHYCWSDLNSSLISLRRSTGEVTNASTEWLKNDFRWRYRDSTRAGWPFSDRSRCWPSWPTVSNWTPVGPTCCPRPRTRPWSSSSSTRSRPSSRRSPKPSGTLVLVNDQRWKALAGRGRSTRSAVPDARKSDFHSLRSNRPLVAGQHGHGVRDERGAAAGPSGVPQLRRRRRLGVALRVAERGHLQLYLPVVASGRDAPRLRPLHHGHRVLRRLSRTLSVVLVCINFFLIFTNDDRLFQFHQIFFFICLPRLTRIQFHFATGGSGVQICQVFSGC